MAVISIRLNEEEEKMVALNIMLDLHSYDSYAMGNKS